MQTIKKFGLLLLAAFCADLVLLFVVQKQVSVFVGLLLVIELFKQELDWFFVIPLLFIYTLEHFMITGASSGLALFYLFPFVFLCRWAKSNLHFSKLFYPAFLLLLLVLEGLVGGIFFDHWGILNIVPW